MKHVLAGVDGSECSMKAAQVGADIAARFGATLTLAYVPPFVPGLAESYIVLADDIVRAQEEEAREIVKGLEERIRAPGLKIETEILPIGAPAETLVDAAEREAADLIVVGSRGRSRLARAVLGSVSDRVVRISKRPVLIVH